MKIRQCYKEGLHIPHEWNGVTPTGKETLFCEGVLGDMPVRCFNESTHSSHIWQLGEGEQGKRHCLGYTAPNHFKGIKDGGVFITDWEHIDGTACNAGFMATEPIPSPNDYWWCTTHQLHLRVIPDSPVTHSHGQHTTHTHADYPQHQRPIEDERIVAQGMGIRNMSGDEIPKEKIHTHEFIGFSVRDCPACYPPKTREVARWADEAMFKAEPIDASDGPRVYLLWMTPDPLGAISAACKMYKGEVVRDLSEITDAERLEYFQQIQNTKLQAPFEFVKFHFMIEGVTRAFTHQMVRQRTAAYAQESLRFAVKEDMPVGLPPSLAGTDEAGMRVDGDESPMTREEEMRVIWNVAKQNIDHAYSRLVDMGMPAEDARGLLPTNILTRLHYTTDLRALLDHAGNRLCTQAQFEWRIVFARIIEAIRGMDHKYTAPPGCIGEKPDWKFQAEGMTRAYLARELLAAFRPVCFQTGRCEFKANFDRHCAIRDRVDTFEANGVPSSQWEKGVYMSPAEEDFLQIKPGEWLLDPGAARKKSQ